MDALSPPSSYADSLSFAAELTDAATLLPGGEDVAERWRRPLQDKLRSHEQSNWHSVDNPSDYAVAASGPLRATAEYLVVRHSLAMPAADTTAATRWPLLEDRIANLRATLRFAAATSEHAHPIEVDDVAKPWFQGRLDELLAPPGPGEGLRELEERVRQGVLVCYRYHRARYELFADRHWEGRPEAPWWCPHVDLALRAPFDGHVRGDRPTYALRLDTTGDRIEGAFAVANRYGNPPRLYPVTVTGGAVTVPDDLAQDPLCGPAVHHALRALGHRVEDPPGPPEGASCNHRWVWSGLPERMRRRADELERQPPLERVRALLGGHVSDTESLDEIRAGLRPVHHRALRLDLRALDAILAEPQPPGLLSELVAWEANWVLDDPSDQAADAFLRRIADILRDVIAEADQRR